MKKLFKVLNAVMIALPGVVILMIVLTITVNNFTAKGVEKKLRNLPLPENTELIDSVSRAEKLSGNGNGMQYYGAILIKSEKTIDELEKFYSQYRENEWESLRSMK